MIARGEDRDRCPEAVKVGKIRHQWQRGPTVIVGGYIAFSKRCEACGRPCYEVSNKKARPRDYKVYEVV